MTIKSFRLIYLSLLLLTFGCNPMYTTTSTTTNATSDNSIHIDGNDNTYIRIDSINIDSMTGDLLSQYSDVGNTDSDISSSGDGTGIGFEEDGMIIRDYELDGALAEERVLDDVAEGLSYDYELSIENGYRMAKIATAWNKMSKDRSMTSGDTDVFMQEFLNVSLENVNEVINKVRKGDLEAADEIYDAAAEHYDISSENIKMIINGMM